MNIRCDRNKRQKHHTYALDFLILCYQISRIKKCGLKLETIPFFQSFKSIFLDMIILWIILQLWALTHSSEKFLDHD